MPINKKERIRAVWKILLPLEDKMELLKDFKVSNIVISEDFANTAPAEKKIERARKRLEHGVDTAAIVLNNDNVLIDGYCTYLAAKELGMEHITATRGYEELIEAVHGSSKRIFRWRVPPYLIGEIKPGDRCIVLTCKGAKRVRVKNVVQQQTPDIGRSVRKVIKKCV